MRIPSIRPAIEANTVAHEHGKRRPGSSLSRGKALAALLLGGVLQAFGPAAAQAQDIAFDGIEPMPELRRITGYNSLEYTPIELTNGRDFDILAIRHMQRINDWLYVGVGAFAPMVEGNYGGFYGADVNVHVQRQVFGNWFLNGGLSFGAAAGGSSTMNIARLSGEGLYARAYAGVGYAFENFSVGLNYNRISVTDSLIDGDAISLFVQRPFGYSVGAYDDMGHVIQASAFDAPQHENMISMQYNHATQIDPQMRYTGAFGLATLQYSHFLSQDFYSFFGIDLGVSGMLWYNQAQGGVGRRFALTDRVNLYGQIGVGSAGWVTNMIDTGPGVIIYPKVMLEYLWDNGLGATLQAGYLYAPLGSSRNWTVGLGLNYHMTHAPASRGGDPDGAYTLRGIQVAVLGRATSEITFNGRTSEGLTMAAVQIDYALDENWYVAAHMAAGTAAFRGIAGYAEGFVGPGYRMNLTSSGRLQGYAQVLWGWNDVGIDAAHEIGSLLYPSFGLNYQVSDRVGIYGQVGATVSLGQYFGTHTNFFENYSVGLGLSYRFSLPTRS